MSDREIIAACAATHESRGDRPSDTTDAQRRWVLQRLCVAPHRLLEIGSGNGVLSLALRNAGHCVTQLDLFPTGSAIGCAEHLPFADGSFDCVVATHTIEHVRSLTKTFNEIARVARRALLVVPMQRFYRVTFDYHLHFFYSPEHFASHIPSGTAKASVIDGDIVMDWATS